MKNRTKDKKAYSFLIRTVCLVMILCSYPVLTGLDFADVALKNADESDPLVDLSKIISLGGSHMPDDNEFISEDETADAADAQTKEDKTGDLVIDLKAPREMVISGRNVYINGQPVTGSKTVLTRLTYMASNDIPLKLDTEYAELYTYMEIDSLIRESGVKVIER